jgi:hypothetical protein
MASIWRPENQHSHIPDGLSEVGKLDEVRSFHWLFGPG